MANKLKEIKNSVHILLQNYPHLRDDDNRLVANIWNEQIGKKLRLEMSAFELLTMISLGKLTSFDTITRIRRKIQEERPELRGNKYKERQNKQIKVKQDLKNL